MADAPVYIIANFDVEDAGRYHESEKGFFPILKAHQGQLITNDDHAETLDGKTPQTGRVVIFSFPSEEAAKRWYQSPNHQALAEHRRAGTRLEFITLVHGLPP